MPYEKLVDAISKRVRGDFEKRIADLEEMVRHFEKYFPKKTLDRSTESGVTCVSDDSATTKSNSERSEGASEYNGAYAGEMPSVETETPAHP